MFQGITLPRRHLNKKPVIDNVECFRASGHYWVDDRAAFVAGPLNTSSNSLIEFWQTKSGATAAASTARRFSRIISSLFQCETFTSLEYISWSFDTPYLAQIAKQPARRAIKTSFARLSPMYAVDTTSVRSRRTMSCKTRGSGLVSPAGSSDILVVEIL